MFRLKRLKEDDSIRLKDYAGVVQYVARNKPQESKGIIFIQSNDGSKMRVDGRDARQHAAEYTYLREFFLFLFLSDGYGTLT